MNQIIKLNAPGVRLSIFLTFIIISAIYRSFLEAGLGCPPWSYNIFLQGSS